VSSEKPDPQSPVPIDFTLKSIGISFADLSQDLCGSPEGCTMILVVVPNRVQKDLFKVPRHIRLRLSGWIRSVELRGLEEVRRIQGYHDEPLKGLRAGQRSIRLNRSYRAIYETRGQGDIKIVEIKEVTKHGY